MNFTFQRIVELVTPKEGELYIHGTVHRNSMLTFRYRASSM